MQRQQAILRNPLRSPAVPGKAPRPSSSLAIPHLCGMGPRLIILYHPRATRPRNRRLPLAVLALAAALEGKEEYEIIDGNLEDDPVALILQLIDRHKVELLGVSAMPGPQMVAAMETSREIRRLR